MRVILHIGTEKTGTTSIQAALNADRRALKAKGILYPSLLGSTNHSELYVLSGAALPGDDVLLWEETRTGLSGRKYVAACTESFLSEVSEGRYHTLVLSCEFFHSRVASSEMVLDAIESLCGYIPSVRVLVYLRRQDELAVSAFSTRIKMGDVGRIFDLPIYSRNENYLNYRKLIELYQCCFGRDSVSPRIYDRTRLIGGDVVRDFYSAAALGISPSVVHQKNVSLSDTEARFLLRFNSIFPLTVDGEFNAMRGPIVDVIAGKFPGLPLLPARRDAERFLSQFIESNEWVRKEFFDDSSFPPTLFNDSMTMYPESAERELNDRDLLKVIELIWVHSRKESIWHSAQLESLRSRSRDS